MNSQSFYNNNIYDMDHGIACGANASGAVIANLYIYNNHFHDMANWDTAPPMLITTTTFIAGPPRVKDSESLRLRQHFRRQ